MAIDIPRFIRHLLVRDLDGALDVIHENNLFPSICGRVCPQESQCEAQCIIAKKVESVAHRAAGALRRRSRARRPSEPPRAGDAGQGGHRRLRPGGPRLRRRSGALRRRGRRSTRRCTWSAACCVTAFRRSACRATSSIARCSSLRDLGVKFETNKVIGKTFTVQQLLDELGYDAVFIGVGAGAPSFLGIPGGVRRSGVQRQRIPHPREPDGRRSLPTSDTPVAVGKRVVVIGAGNTAMDCLRVSSRSARRRSRCVYRRSRGRGAGAHRGAAPRQGRGHRLPLPALAGRDPHQRRRQRARHQVCRR